MQIIPIPDPKGHNYQTPPKIVREYHAAKATALDAELHPILAAHWPGLLLVGGQLAVNDAENPIVRRFAEGVLGHG